MGGDYRQHAGAVYERDDWTCKLCGLPVAKDRSAPHPLAPSLDHIKPQSLAGSDDPDNLQTAHLRCNESKHMRPARGSSLTVKMQAPPEMLEILELLRRLPPVPEPEDEEPRTPLLEVSTDDIGDVFDAAVKIARRAQVRRLPDVDKLRRWASRKGFLTRSEARYSVHEQLYGCLDESAICESVRYQVIQEQPASWFVAKFLMAGDGPEWLEDEDGWQEVAGALVDYIGLDELDEMVSNVIAELSVPDPLQRIDADADSAAAFEPGMYRGHPLWAYDDSVRELKRAGRLAECEQLLLALIDSLEAYVKRVGGSLSPHHYEQLAIVRRKTRDASGEVEVLERYFAYPGALDSVPLHERLAKARAKQSAD